MVRITQYSGPPRVKDYDKRKSERPRSLCLSSFKRATFCSLPAVLHAQSDIHEWKMKKSIIRKVGRSPSLSPKTYMYINRQDIRKFYSINFFFVFLSVYGFQCIWLFELSRGKSTGIITNVKIQILGLLVKGFGSNVPQLIPSSFKKTPTQEKKTPS